MLFENGYIKNVKIVKYVDEPKEKVIDFSRIEITLKGKFKKPHTHVGYVHDEKGTYSLSPKEKKMVDRVNKTWDYYFKRSG